MITPSAFLHRLRHRDQQARDADDEDPEVLTAGVWEYVLVGAVATFCFLVVFLVTRGPW